MASIIVVRKGLWPDLLSKISPRIPLKTSVSFLFNPLRFNERLETHLKLALYSSLCTEIVILVI